MKRIAAILFFIIFPGFFLTGISNNYYTPENELDTIPPPPGGPIPLNGPESACIGATCLYFTEVPVSCTCQWAVNGIIQPDTSSSVLIIWTQAGINNISVTFICNGQPAGVQTLAVIIDEMPDPGPIIGDENVCELTYHTYIIDAGPSDSCAWTVNGILQQETGPALTYFFGAAGLYHFSVTAYNSCGASSQETLDVTANGAAPGTPAPIEGAGESCIGYQETYTTEVGPGESCSWWIDGIIQPTTTTTLAVTWAAWGEHQIEVRAVSSCGTGNPAYKDVLVLGAPQVFLGNDTTIIQGQTLTLDAGNPGSEYLWSTGEMTRTITVGVAGTYSVSVTNFCGEGYDEIVVDVSTGMPDKLEINDLRIGILNDLLIFHAIPVNLLNIKVLTIDGKVLYQGNPVRIIRIPSKGIIMVQLITSEYSYTKKLFIF